MKTMLAICSLIVMLPLLAGCREKEKSDNGRSRFTIVQSYQNISGDTSRIRFNRMSKKDEKTLAMEKAAGQWNRNLYLMGGNPSLAEYADSCGAEK